jgi:hypothetical protein
MAVVRVIDYGEMLVVGSMAGMARPEPLAKADQRCWNRWANWMSCGNACARAEFLRHEFEQARTTTDEQVVKYDLRESRLDEFKTVDGVRWMVPLAIEALRATSKVCIQASLPGLSW